MIRLHECDRIPASSKNDALIFASNYTGFDKNDFKCEVIQEPKRVGLFKKEDGIYHCWYEYHGMNADKELRIADTKLYFDISQRKILILRNGFKAYEVSYEDLLDYEMVIKSNSKTYTLSNQNKALKGAVLFGVVGAVVGSADSKVITETAEFAELIIRLKYHNKESFEILTCFTPYDTSSKLWRDILDQSKTTDEYLKELFKS